MAIQSKLLCDIDTCRARGPEDQRTRGQSFCHASLYPDLHETFFFPSSIDQIHRIAVWVTSSAISRVGLPMRMTLCPVVQELPRTMLTTVLTRSDWRSLANISILFCREILSQVVSVGAKVSPFRQSCHCNMCPYSLFPASFAHCRNFHVPLPRFYE